jgi:hypothetical protein
MPVLFAGRLEDARSAVDKARQMFPAESFGLGLTAIFSGIEGDHPLYRPQDFCPLTC